MHTPPLLLLHCPSCSVIGHVHASWRDQIGLDFAVMRTGCSCQRYLGMLLTCAELEDGSLVMRQHWPAYNCDAISGRSALATVGIVVFILGIPAFMLYGFHIYHAHRIKSGLHTYLICSIWAGYCASLLGFFGAYYCFSG